MYKGTFFEFYKCVFMLELLAAELLYAFPLAKKSKFPLRLILAIVICFAITVFLPVFVYEAWYSSLVFLFLFGISLIALKMCFDVSWSDILFVGIAGYTTQHLAYIFEEILMTVTGFNGNSQIYGQESVFGLTVPELLVRMIYFLLSRYVVYWICWLVFGRKFSHYSSLTIKNKSLLFLTGILFLSNIILGAIATYHSYYNKDATYIVLFDIMGAICCTILLFIQFELLLHRELEEDMKTMDRLYVQQKEQYEKAEENIEIINIKCHDLKHQIHQIGKTKQIDEGTIQEMTNALSIYDTRVKTGNEALDIILTEKSLYCYQNHIKLTCIADGKILSNMDKADIFSLFGNLIDNAIEAVKNLSDSKKTIGLDLRRSHNFISINVHNYFEGKIQYENGLPVTTKKDKENHGFGFKSIRYICNKYNGNFSIDINGQVFSVTVLMPLNIEKKQEF